MEDAALGLMVIFSFGEFGDAVSFAFDDERPLILILPLTWGLVVEPSWDVLEDGGDGSDVTKEVGTLGACRSERSVIFAKRVLALSRSREAQCPGARTGIWS